MARRRRFGDVPELAFNIGLHREIAAPAGKLPKSERDRTALRSAGKRGAAFNAQQRPQGLTRHEEGVVRELRRYGLERHKNALCSASDPLFT